MFPSIEPEDVGVTGLLWLFLSYGFVLYYASGLIGEGSELLLLVPSLAGLVGGVVLPLLGAVPDGAIILFSGLGSIEEAQETLSVGVGALAGSTIMLLTVPFALSVYGGRVDLDSDGVPQYLKKPKLTVKSNAIAEFTQTGVALTDPVKAGGKIMMITTIPYFLIQVPASFIHGAADEVAEGEKWYALFALIFCLIGLFYYMRLQLQMSKAGEDKEKRVAVMKKMLTNGKVSLSGALHGAFTEPVPLASQEYNSMDDTSAASRPPPEVDSYLREILMDSFRAYDEDRNGHLDKKEVYTLFRDYNESITDDAFDQMFQKYDVNNNGNIDFDEFICISFELIKAQERVETQNEPQTEDSVQMNAMVQNIMADTEEEEIPEDFTDLSPEQQQTAIKKRAFIMLTVGTVLVVLFSDPMVDVMQEIATRANLSPFYVSFILAPLASNASEVLASQYYASKKTTKTITVSLTALEGAASMNNSFCLAIFMGLIFFRGLAWQYTAETIAILLVEIIIGFMVQKDSLSLSKGVLIASIFPLSIVLVAVLEHFGLD